MRGNCDSTLPNGSYDSSGGVYGNGYCIWKDGVLISSHCKEGYECGGAPPKDVKPRFEGECIRVACTKNPTPE